MRWPDYYAAAPTVVRIAPDAAVGDVLDQVVGHVQAWGSDEVLVWCRLDAPAGLEATLQERGGRLDETLDVLALDLGAGLPALDPPSDVEVRWQDDEATTRDVIRIGIEAFGEGTVPDDARVAALAAEAAADLAAGRTATAVGYLDGRAVGAGGLTLADGVARLWGGGVVPDARGRGVYRAVLDARLRHAAELGAATALVKGRVETSGPVLRRAGFEVFGQERSYRLSPGAGLLTSSSTLRSRRPPWPASCGPASRWPPARATARRGRRRRRSWSPTADRAGVVDHVREDRQRAVTVVGDLDEPRLLRPVDVRGGVDLPEARRRPARRWAVTALRCVWPLTQAITSRWPSSSASDLRAPGTRGSGSPPVPTNGLSIVARCGGCTRRRCRPVVAPQQRPAARRTGSRSSEPSA